MTWKDGEVSKRGRHDRLLEQEIHDPYMTRAKHIEPTVCPECGVVYNNGRWQWLPEIPSGANKELCPACQRIQDKVPAGYLTLKGEFFSQHQDEIMNLLHNKVDAEKSQHPMKRLMDAETQEDGSILITFTDMHLPRGIGEAIERAYEGELEIQYTEQAGILRVYWQR